MKKIVLTVFMCILCSLSFTVLAQFTPVNSNSVPDQWGGRSTPDDAPCDKGDISLNTNIPFVWPCIKTKETSDTGETTLVNVFPKLMWWLTRIVMSVVVIIWFFGILVAGFMIATGGVKSDMMSKGKDLIIKIIAGLALVGIAGIILNLINPNFFKTGNSWLIMIQKTISNK